MSSATPRSEEKGSTTSYADKNWTACSNTKAVLIELLSD